MIVILTIFLGMSLALIYFIYYLLMIKRSRERENWKNNEVLREISVIIPTYNEEATISRKLENLLEQDYPKKLLEIVIIDSGSTDRTVSLVEKFVQNHSEAKVLFLKESERVGKTHAVNMAYSKSSGEIKIISDSDALLEKNAIRRVVNNFADSRVGAVTGRQILMNPEHSAATAMEEAYRRIYQVLRIGESFVDSTPIFHGELAAYKADLIEPLPENKSADDSRLANIIRKKGFRAVYDRDAIFYEYAPPSFKARYIQKVRRGQGLIRVFWDFKNVLFKPKYGKYGLIVMPAEFFMHCVSPFIVVALLALFIVSVLEAPLFFIRVSTALALLLLFSFVLSKTKVFRERQLPDVHNLFISFVSSQLILFAAILLCIQGKSLHKWQKVEEIRKEWQS